MPEGGNKKEQPKSPEQINARILEDLKNTLQTRREALPDADFSDFDTLVSAIETQMTQGTDPETIRNYLENTTHTLHTFTPDGQEHIVQAEAAAIQRKEAEHQQQLHTRLQGLSQLLANRRAVSPDADFTAFRTRLSNLEQAFNDGVLTAEAVDELWSDLDTVDPEALERVNRNAPAESPETLRAELQSLYARASNLERLAREFGYDIAGSLSEALKPYLSNDPDIVLDAPTLSRIEKHMQAQERLFSDAIFRRANDVIASSTTTLQRDSQPVVATHERYRALTDPVQSTEALNTAVGFLRHVLKNEQKKPTKPVEIPALSAEQEAVERQFRESAQELRTRAQELEMLTLQSGVSIQDRPTEQLETGLLQLEQANASNQDGFNNYITEVNKYLDGFEAHIASVLYTQTEATVQKLNITGNEQALQDLSANMRTYRQAFNAGNYGEALRFIIEASQIAVELEAMGNQPQQAAPPDPFADDPITEVHTISAEEETTRDDNKRLRERLPIVERALGEIPVPDPNLKEWMRQMLFSINHHLDQHTTEGNKSARYLMDHAQLYVRVYRKAESTRSTNVLPATVEEKISKGLSSKNRVDLKNAEKAIDGFSELKKAREMAERRASQPPQEVSIPDLQKPKVIVQLNDAKPEINPPLTGTLDQDIVLSGNPPEESIGYLIGNALHDWPDREHTDVGSTISEIRREIESEEPAPAPPVSENQLPQTEPSESAPHVRINPEVEPEAKKIDIVSTSTPKKKSGRLGRFFKRVVKPLALAAAFAFPSTTQTPEQDRPPVAQKQEQAQDKKDAQVPHVVAVPSGVDTQRPSEETPDIPEGNGKAKIHVAEKPQKQEAEQPQVREAEERMVTSQSLDVRVTGRGIRLSVRNALEDVLLQEMMSKTRTVSRADKSYAHEIATRAVMDAVIALRATGKELPNTVPKGIQSVSYKLNIKDGKPTIDDLQFAGFEKKAEGAPQKDNPEAQEANPEAPQNELLEAERGQEFSVAGESFEGGEKRAYTTKSGKTAEVGIVGKSTIYKPKKTHNPHTGVIETLYIKEENLLLKPARGAQFALPATKENMTRVAKRETLWMKDDNIMVEAHGKGGFAVTLTSDTGKPTGMGILEALTKGFMHAQGMNKDDAKLEARVALFAGDQVAVVEKGRVSKKNLKDLTVYIGTKIIVDGSGQVSSVFLR